MTAEKYWEQVENVKSKEQAETLADIISKDNEIDSETWSKLWIALRHKWLGFIIE